MKKFNKSVRLNFRGDRAATGELRRQVRARLQHVPREHQAGVRDLPGHREDHRHGRRRRGRTQHRPLHRGDLSTWL